MQLPNEYHNAVLNRDVMEVLQSLPDCCIDTIYGDPDYNVGIKYAGKSYTTKWNEYLEWYCALAKESMRVLKPTGNAFFINYPKQNAYLQVRQLDAVSHDVFNYVWVYNTNVGHSPRRFTTAHRSVLHATKTDKNKWFKEQVAQPYLNPNDRRIKKIVGEGAVGRMPYSWLNFNLVKNVSKEKTIHPCQIPTGLSELLISASTKPGDSVFVLFGGSGSEAMQARKMGRTFITCELDQAYCDIIKSRLANCS